MLWIKTRDLNIDLIYFIQVIQYYLITPMNCRFIPTVTTPTRMTSYSEACTDSVLNVMLILFNSCVLFKYISDHLPPPPPWQVYFLYQKGLMYIPDSYQPISFFSILKKAFEIFCAEMWWSSLRNTVFCPRINLDIVNYIQALYP